MNTSNLSLSTTRPGYRTLVGGVFHRVGEALEKLWSLSGRVSLPYATASTEVARLPRGTVLALEKADGVSRLEITRGTLWITGTPAGGDMLIGPGGTCEFGNRWPYVIEALADAEFIFSGAVVEGAVVTS